MAANTVDPTIFEQAATVTDEWLRSVSNVLDAPCHEGTVPALWHWMLFQSWPPRKGLRSDGGVDNDPVLPSFPEFPRRMAAAGSLTFHRSLKLGDRVTARRSLSSTERKMGKAGPLVFVTIKTDILVSEELAVAEESVSVFMKLTAENSGVDARKRMPMERESFGAAESFPVFCDPVLLFRYSALTSNSHRIHYDHPYAMSEGLRGLVVHGPLQATWLASTAQTMIGDRPLVSFGYEHRNPAFCGDDLTVTALRHPEHSIDLALETKESGVCTKAVARY